MMHGRTTDIHSDCLGRAHGPAVHLLYAVALFLLLAVDSWGACISVNQRIDIFPTMDFSTAQPPGTGVYCAMGPSCSSDYRNCKDGLMLSLIHI